MAIYTSTEPVFVEQDGIQVPLTTTALAAQIVANEGIETLKGPPGTDGAPGLDGAPGADGRDGVDGTAGADGRDGAGVPAGGTTGQRLRKTSGTDFDTAWVDDTRTLRTSHTFAVAGAVTAATLPGMFVAATTGQTVRLALVRARIRSGTSVSYRLQRNGADVAGFGTSGAPLTATTSAASTDPTDVTLAAGDELTVVVSAVSGAPADLTVTLALEHTV